MRNGDSLPSNPCVSIAIVTYNQENFIAEAMMSALKQDYEPLELVVSDDASTDRTPDIIRLFARRYPGRVVPVLNRRNRGITGNSNAALRACSGDLIAFLGGDDVLLPGKIAAQVQWFRDHADGVLCGHECEVFYDDGFRSPHPLDAPMRSGKGPSDFIRNGPFGALSVMIRKQAIPAWGFDDQLPTVSDQMLWVDVLAKGGEFGFVPGVFARHRRHDSNVTNNPLQLAEDHAEQLRIIERRYPQFSRDCRHAWQHHVLYTGGVALMQAGHKLEARRRFLQTLASNPLFLRAWIRLAQSFA